MIAQLISYYAELAFNELRSSGQIKPKVRLWEPWVNALR